MKAKSDCVLEMCIDEGIKLGWNRAHKYSDEPTEQDIQHHIKSAIWGEIFEWFEFEGETE